MVMTGQSQIYHLCISITTLIKSCKAIHQLKQIHAHSVARGRLSHCSSSKILTNVLNALSTLTAHKTSFSLLHYSVSIFNSIQNPSTFCYNIIIRLHTLHFSPLSALHFFLQMRRFSVLPDFHSYPFLLKACAQLHVFSLAQSIHSQVFKFGLLSDLYIVNSLIHVYSLFDHLNNAHQLFDESSHKDVVSYNALIDGFVKAGDFVKARELFDLMPVRDCVSWGTLLAGYAHGGYCMEAIDLFDLMLDLKVIPDNIALVAVLSACAQLGKFEKGKQVHDYIESSRIRVDSFLSTGLVDFYSKCGYIDIALKFFESSPDKNLITWNAMLIGLALHGHGNLMLNFFSRMIGEGVEPDGVSLLGVLVGCSHGGLVNEARKFFHGMEYVYGVPRELKHYGCMVDLLGRAGLIKEAVEMIKDLPIQGDMFVWSGLLGGCRIHGDFEVAEKAAKQVMELKPEDGGVYSMLANVYANAGKWEDVVKVRRLMSSNRVVKKNTARSLIQLDGVTHEFLSEDSLHARINEIRMALEGIREHQCEL